MRKSARLIFILSISAYTVVFISGCHKNGIVDGRVKSSLTITTLNNVQSIKRTDYLYDGQNRAIKISSYDSTGLLNEYTTYMYTDTALYEVRFNASGSVIDSVIYRLNSQGYVVSQDGKSYSYAYDANGYLIRSDINGHFRNYIYNNGNRMSLTDSSVAGVYTALYTYDSKPNYRTTGMNFMGKGNKNLIDASETSGVVSSITTNTYTFDAEGRVHSSTTVVTGTNPVSVTASYTYF